MTNDRDIKLCLDNAGDLGALGTSDYPQALSAKWYETWAQALRASYRQLLGASLSEQMEEVSSNNLPRTLFDAPFALVAHGSEPDPIFCFANRAVLALFGYEWEGFTRLPSRLSAEPENSRRRRELLEQVTR